GSDQYALPVEAGRIEVRNARSNFFRFYQIRNSFMYGRAVTSSQRNSANAETQRFQKVPTGGLGAQARFIQYIFYGNRFGKFTLAVLYECRCLLQFFQSFPIFLFAIHLSYDKEIRMSCLLYS